MAQTVTDLITQAYYDSGVVARQFQEIQGYQLADGLRWLNEILGDNSVDTGDIPYITQQYPFDGVVGQEKYFIPGLLSIDALVFYIPSGTGPNSATSLRYQMQYMDRIKYFGQPRANNINALPVSYTYERTFGGSNIWVYFPPQQNYRFNITGNFFMQSVTLNQDLTTVKTVANLGVPSISGTVTNLGVASIVGAGILAAGELVVNNVDLAGTYATVNDLINYINTGVVDGVSAQLSGANFTLIGSVPSISIETLGTVTVNGVTFGNFNTTAGPLTEQYLQPGALEIGELVINDVDLTGAYATAQDLVDYINTGIIDFVTASILDFEFILTSNEGVTISVKTLGSQPISSNITFKKFSTINGPFSQVFYGFALDQFYIDYLEYRLAARICQKLNFAVPDGVREQLTTYQRQIKKLSEPLDLSMQKISCLSQARGLNYAMANLGKGYTTGGF